MLPNIHLLGIQGSGKGTQSALLVEDLSLTYISSGNLFRARAKIADQLGEKIQKELNQGHLLPNDLLINTVKDFCEKTPIPIGLLGDGVIRTAEQYQRLLPIWEEFRLDQPLLIHFLLSEDEALRRIEQRKKEAQDKEKLEYHRIYSGKLVQREDDNPAAIKERFKIFDKMTTPVIELFEKTGRCIHVDASESIENIHACTLEKIKLIYPNL